MSTGVETLEFQAEARQLLRLMVHSIYSNKDIFLRELISNASDALDKLRLATLTDKDLQADISDLHITVVPDAQARTLTVVDNGIGMSRDEVVRLIGTIAKSGTAELLERLNEARESAGSQTLIGQFGVGFYASFMVADRVTLLTRRAGEDTATRWESAGEGTYTIESVADAPIGTSVTLHLKAEDAEDHLFDYTAEAKIREIVKTYSDFITWPVRLGDETLNSMKALWARPKEEVAAEEYHEFYKHISHDWTDPLETIRLKAEGTFEYEALLFLPSRAPFDLHMREGRHGVQLYVKRVFIMDNCQALMPDYLRFVKGVVDAHDLSLNISREILQQDRQIQLMRRRLVKKVLATLKDLATSDAQRYETFWREFGPTVKEGLLSDFDNQSAILDVALFASTHAPADSSDSSGAEALTTLAAYVARMPEDQEHIYYITGESRAMIEKSPHLEAFLDKGYEVLLLSDPVDEMWAEMVPAFEDKPLRSIAKGEVDLSTQDERENTEVAREQQRKEFATMLAWLGGVLGEQVLGVRLSSRLTSSPACLVSDSGDMTPTLEKLYRAMGREVPPVKRTLELNPTHPLVTGLRDAFAARPTDASLAQTGEVLLGIALLAEGGDLSDPARFTQLVAERLAEGLNPHEAPQTNIG